MIDKEHQSRHIELHKALDELIADHLTHRGKLPSETTVMELVEWSHQQTKNLTLPFKSPPKMKFEDKQRVRDAIDKHFPVCKTVHQTPCYKLIQRELGL